MLGPVRPAALLATPAALLVLAAAPVSASAANVWAHQGTTTGNVLGVNTIVTGSLKASTAGVVITTSGSVTCRASSLEATVGASNMATIGINVSTLSLTSCTDTLPLITVTRCDVYVDANNSLSVATGTTATTVGTTTSIPVPSSMTLKCPVGGLADPCYWRMANQSGTATYTDNGAGTITAGELSYPNLPIAKAASPTSNGGCPNTGTFGVTWAPFKVDGGTFVGFNNNP